ncbi:MAG: peptide chain release factor 1 [Labilithrix sp.]|nr:peptide chain release factor 1 [Labilithrix sp.]MCW5814910.1 peptide chain release factor 1 [Labilithrix sp.]
MLPVEKLEQLTRRYAELDELMCRPDVLGDRNQLGKLTKERSDLEALVAAFGRYRETEKKLKEDEEALADPELRELVEAEIPELRTALATLEGEIQVLLLPSDPNDKKNVILEIRGGEGGEEAALFAADLFRMYTRYAETLGWSIELLSMSESATGGYKEVIALVSGKDVYSSLRYEGGVHRVQRVPATETQGRIHTSTATVAVLPEADDVDVQIDEKDLEISIAASGGPGGQGVNTTNSAVQIQHKPTGLIVKCQDERSQLKNKAKAMKVLKSRLLDIEREKQEAALSAERRGMVGTGERSQKIRTYNYPQNRVSDHRIKLTINKLDRIVEGDLEEIVTALRTYRQAALLNQVNGGTAAGLFMSGGDEDDL